MLNKNSSYVLIALIFIISISSSVYAEVSQVDINEIATDNFIQIINSSGTYNESYIYYYDKLVGKKNSDGTINYYHPDALGSTSLITNSSGGKVESIDYQPFGKETANTSQRYTYTGHEKEVFNNEK